MFYGNQDVFITFRFSFFWRINLTNLGLQLTIIFIVD